MNKNTLPRHHRSGLSAVGFRSDGRPIWPIAGGSEADNSGTDAKDESKDEHKDSDDGEEEEDDEEAKKNLGDPGKRALDKMKARVKTARAEAKEYKDLGLTPEQIRALVAKQTPLKEGETPQVDVEKIRREAESAAMKRANERILRAEVVTIAAGKLADPRDAAKLLDLTEFELDEDGNVDEDEVLSAIEELLRKKPYLAAVQDGKSRFKGGADQGSRNGGSGGPSQLSRDELKTMSPKEIEKARQSGRLNNILGIKT